MLVFAVRKTKYARVVFLGNFASGKTAFLEAIQGNACDPLSKVPTNRIESDQLYTIQDESNDRTLILLLEDYPGEESLHDQLPNYYKDAHIVCICVPLDEQIYADNSMIRWINEAANRCRAHFLSELGSGVIGPNVYPTLFL